MCPSRLVSQHASLFEADYVADMLEKDNDEFLVDATGNSVSFMAAFDAAKEDARNHLNS